MRTKNIRAVIVMAIISISGIMVMQVIWYKKAYDLKQRQFDHTLYLSLQNVAEQLLKYNQTQVPLCGMVNQISTNYYAVNINGEIKTSVLEFLLKNEFEKRNITIDFEYGVYNCETGKMVYGNYISMKTNEVKTQKSELPLWVKDKYYFSVLFPDKTMYLTSQMGIWLFFNGILFIVCLFFGYALLIILRQKKLSEIQKDFVNNMTHELKTPIATILVSSRLIDKAETTDNKASISTYTQIIVNEASRLQQQVDKVLQIALLDKEKVRFQFQYTDIHALIKEVVDSSTILLADKNGAITYQLNASQQLVNVDVVHLTNLLHNLIDNAIKYCKHSPVINITTFDTAKYLVIQIKDNGIGISKENQKKVFAKFYRVHTGNIHNVKGFGLGLFYVKTIVDGHKGKITIESEIDKGCIVNVYLPFNKSSKQTTI